MEFLFRNIFITGSIVFFITAFIANVGGEYEHKPWQQGVVIVCLLSLSAIITGLIGWVWC